MIYRHFVSISMTPDSSVCTLILLLLLYCCNCRLSHDYY